MAHDILGNDARKQELKKIIAAASFRTAAAHLESTEWMTTDDCAGAGAIDIDIARHQFGLNTLDICRAPREKSGSKRVVCVVGDRDGFDQGRAPL